MSIPIFGGRETTFTLRFKLLNILQALIATDAKVHFGKAMGFGYFHLHKFASCLKIGRVL